MAPKPAGSSGPKKGALPKLRLVEPAPKGEAGVFQIKITLKDVKPAIWRRFQVAGDVKFFKLSRIIQMVMGWHGGHLHEFVVGGKHIGVPDPDFPALDEIINEKSLRLNEVVKDEKAKFFYEYDFGDGWRHELVVEKILPRDKELRLPRCLAGKRNGPPEDCGGPWGYMDLVKAIANPNHPEHDEITEWLGFEFDPEEFDLEGINMALSKLR
ncbi:MAG: plasmid pRiA4b ORF-3 family protein [Desulfarculus sp.]|nr:plasmid pRiA4b ORF-3 family protein [Desulfarculus sp.]